MLLRNCRFSRTTFEACCFARIAFEGSAFSEVDARDCDFSGIVSDERWWPEQSGTPFTSMVEAYIRVTEERCGQQSVAASVLKRYLERYRACRTKSRDFTAGLYSGEVPDRELDALEESFAFDTIAERYPF